MAERILVAWLGNNDLKAANVLPGRLSDSELGPIAESLVNLKFDTLHLLCNQSKADTDSYLKWLSGMHKIKAEPRFVSLTSPIHFGDIYQATNSALTNISTQAPKAEIVLHLSPGTPAMTAVFILLGKTKFLTKFIQSTQGKGASNIELPFDIAAEYIPSTKTIADQNLFTLAAGEAPVNAEFDDIITRNPFMRKLIEKAEAIAKRDVPALILGESGTGKELFAKAIHNASARKNKPLVVVNCGAIPKDLIDSELFGHAKGAFSGAVVKKKAILKLRMKALYSWMNLVNYLKPHKSGY